LRPFIIVFRRAKPLKDWSEAESTGVAIRVGAIAVLLAAAGLAVFYHHHQTTEELRGLRERMAEEFRRDHTSSEFDLVRAANLADIRTGRCTYEDKLLKCLWGPS